MATVAVFAALGGGAYAAIQLPVNSVGKKQIRNGAVTSVKVKDRSLLGRDFKPGQLPAGARGPSDAYFAQHDSCDCGGETSVHLSVPAGDYTVSAVDVAANADDTAGHIHSASCALTGGGQSQQSSILLAPSSGASLVVDAGLHVSVAGTITVSCRASSLSVNLSNLRLTALRVARLNG